MKLFFEYRKINFLFIIFFYFTFSAICIGQDVPFKAKFFKKKQKLFKEALKQLNIADEIMATESDHDKAIRFYERAYKFNSRSIDLNFKLALCHIKGDRTDPLKAKTFLEQLVELDAKKKPEAFYYLGYVHHLASSWDEAKSHYKKYLRKIEKLPPSQKQLMPSESLAIRKLAQCQYGKAQVSHVNRVLIKNLGRRVNSLYPDYGAVFTPNLDKMYFTSRRNKTTGFDADLDDHYYEDIYEVGKTDKDWSRIKNIGKPINSNGHESVLSISADGKKMLVYRGINQGDIYISTRKGKVWSEPVAFSKPINTKYKEVAACFANNGRTIYLVSNRPGTLGGLDIFRTDFKKGKGWSVPKNLGEPVNSPYNEHSVFLSDSGRHLYFSADNENSIGGYDVFMATSNGESWEGVQNLGYPINTTFDDLYYTTDATEQIAHYTTRRADTKGNTDIYQIHFLSPEKKASLAGSNLKVWLPEPDISGWLNEIMEEEQMGKEVILSGTVTTKDGNAIEIFMQLEDALQQKIIYSDTSKIGYDFSYSLNSNASYKLLVQAIGYLPIVQDINLQESENRSLILTPVKKGEKLVLNDIYFATGSDRLTTDSFSSLQQLLIFLKQNRNLKIRLIGHTDNVGSTQSNLLLSKKRAKAVSEWLVAQGISAKRLSFIGKGSKEPVGDNNTDLGRQKNRRTEVEIVGAKK